MGSLLLSWTPMSDLTNQTSVSNVKGGTRRSSELMTAGAPRRLSSRGGPPCPRCGLSVRARGDAPAEGRHRDGRGLPWPAQLVRQPGEADVVAGRDACAPRRLRLPGG